MSYYSGMGASFPVGETSESLRAVQQGLQRMGLLEPGTGARGADGRWGARTVDALATARTVFGQNGFLTSVQGRTATISDNFVAAIQSFGSQPAGGGPPVGPATSQAPAPKTASQGSPVTTANPSSAEAETAEPDSSSGVAMYAVGAVAAVAVGLAVYTFGFKTRKTTSNRRRR